MRWLLLDEIIIVEKKNFARTRSRFPALPVNPFILMIEMMAQTGGLLIGAQSDFQNDVVFTKIDRAEFKAALRAGTAIEIEARCENPRPEGGWVEGEIRSETKTVATARLLLASVSELVPGRGKPVTFPDRFMNHFRVREKIK